MVLLPSQPVQNLNPLDEPLPGGNVMDDYPQPSIVS